MMPAPYLHVAVVVNVMIVDIYWRFICFFPAIFSSDSFGGEIVYYN